jgi:hypothetical protein
MRQPDQKHARAGLAPPGRQLIYLNAMSGRDAECKQFFEACHMSWVPRPIIVGASMVAWLLGIFGAQAPAATIKLVDFYDNQVATRASLKPVLTPSWSGPAHF